MVGAIINKAATHILASLPFKKFPFGEHLGTEWSKVLGVYLPLYETGKFSQSGCATVYSRQQCMRVLVASLSHQHLELSGF